MLFTLAVQTSLEGEGSMVDIRGHARCGSISLVSFSLTQESYPARTCFFLEARLMSLSALFIPSMQSGSLAKGSLAIPRAIPNQPVSSFRNMTPQIVDGEKGSEMLGTVASRVDVQSEISSVGSQDKSQRIWVILQVLHPCVGWNRLIQRLCSATTEAW